jgi:protein arginine kinase activator
MLCQQCKKQTATVHLTDLVKGDKRERHLCEECAAKEGIAVKQHVSINDVLSTFLQSGVQELAKLRCSECGTSFVEFRSQGVLGCPKDYEVFGDALASVIERAQDGETHHTGKKPGQHLKTNPVQEERLRLQRELREAIEREDYEQAAQIRDRLGGLQSQ